VNQFSRALPSQVIERNKLTIVEVMVAISIIVKINSPKSCGGQFARSDSEPFPIRHALGQDVLALRVRLPNQRIKATGDPTNALQPHACCALPRGEPTKSGRVDVALSGIYDYRICTLDVSFRGDPHPGLYSDCLQLGVWDSHTGWAGG